MLEVTTHKKGNATIVSIKGDVDLYSSPQVRKTVMAITAKRTSAVLINLSEVNYMDSSGVATLVEGLQQTGKYKGQFKLYGLVSAVKEVFELSRLDKVFDIYADEASALASLQ